jgi:ATP-dependent RNA helicase SUPV3L1/SUV3
VNQRKALAWDRAVTFVINHDIPKDKPEGSFAAAIDTMLAGARKALIARVGDQLAELIRRIRDLPHIELLTDGDVALTVAPYYGGLNRALKKRRAKSALVAVEERAREAKYVDDVNKLNEQRSAFADVASYYPIARSLQRKLVLYVGPTNSGKTWRSLNDLAEAGSGAYLAPLRLLALEGQEELEKRGKSTSFLTGEERDMKPDASFISSTIEMLDLERQVEAVVIDEVQLLADERRGWAWLAAVLGAPAKKVIMTGSPDCVDIVKDLAQYLGEELTVHECQRHNELRVAPTPIRLKDIRPGTAVVCFSRRDVLRLKASIQEHSEHKVAVVYGNLSPQVRREEARRFRSGEADVLVATDAIAMGLNLPIAEVLFYTIEKFNGEEMVTLSPSEIRQIGGRAGRHGFADFGVVNAMDSRSLDIIREAIKGTSESLKPPFYVAPGPNHIRIISQVLQSDSLERILTFFERAIEFSDERFARSNIDDLSYLSTYVDERLPFREVTERLTIASAPVGIRNETVLNWFINRMLKAFPDPQYPNEETDDLDDLFQEAERFNKETARSQLELRDAEDYLKTLSVYSWLAFRYPQVFTRIEDCEARRESVNAFVERSLKSVPAKRCAACDVKLPADFAYPICDACHGKDKGQRKSRRHRGGRGRAKGSGNGGSQTPEATSVQSAGGGGGGRRRGRR